MRRWIRAGLLLPLLATLLAGCGSAFQQPQITLEDVRIGSAGLSGGTLLVSLEVVNPNRFALNANQITYELALRDPRTANDTTWLEFATGTYDVPFSVGSGATESVQIPVEFTYAGLGGAASALLRTGTLTYRANGVVDVRTPLGTYPVPFNRRGHFTLSGTR